jgi:multiple sugar transport system permease protein
VRLSQQKDVYRKDKEDASMFKKTNPLQSKSEIILRNIVVLAMVIFFTVFLIVPIGIAFAGSFHEWNPLSGTYRFLGLENYKEVFTSALFGKSMLYFFIFNQSYIDFFTMLDYNIHSL